MRGKKEAVFFRFLLFIPILPLNLRACFNSLALAHFIVHGEHQTKFRSSLIKRENI